MQSKLLKQIVKELNTKVNSRRAEWNNNSKPVQPGGYAEGDVFIGVAVPDMRTIALKYCTEISKVDLDWLFSSKIHEYRFLATEILNFIYEKQLGCFTVSATVKYLLKQLSLGNINNWDLVDNTAYTILGDWVYKNNQTDLLYKLAKSSNLWEQRTSIVATMALIRKGNISDTFKLADILLEHDHDLMHKAVGWLLREAGRRDRQKLKQFIIKHYNRFPRTALRYAIEHFPEKERKQFLTAKF